MSRKRETDGTTTEGEVMEIMPQVVDGGAIEKAAIDCQIATAHQYPRSIEMFKKRATEMVTLDEETAASCIYRRPVGEKNGKPEYAEGKSVRMAEIVGACYGNLRAVAQIVEQTTRYVKARGIAHDLESNFASATEVIESTVKRNGEPFSERMRIVVAKAAVAKARRDAIFQVVPAALCKTLEDAARKTAIGDTKTLSSRRKMVSDWINKVGIDENRVYSALGVKGISEVGLKELEVLTGLKTAINDKDITLDEAFPLPGQAKAANQDAEPPVQGDKAPRQAMDALSLIKALSQLPKRPVKDAMTELGFNIDVDLENLKQEELQAILNLAKAAN